MYVMLYIQTVSYISGKVRDLQICICMDVQCVLSKHARLRVQHLGYQMFPDGFVEACRCPLFIPHDQSLLSG